MARKAIKGAIAASVLGQGAAGFGQGIMKGIELEQLMAERAIKNQMLEMEKDKYKQEKAKTLLEARLKLAELERGNSMMDAQGNITSVSGMTGASIGDDLSFIKGPNYSPGSKTVKSMGFNRSAMVPRGKTPEGKAVIFDGEGFKVDGLPYNGPTLGINFQPGAVPSSYQKDIDAFSGAKRNTQEYLNRLLNDLENKDRGIPRKLNTGLGYTTSDLPFSGPLRRAFTSNENNLFFGELRASQSKDLTEATGAQRGMQEVSFLIPASVSPLDTDEVILSKGVQNALTNAINLKRAHGQLSKSYKYDTTQLAKDTELDTAVVDRAITRLKQQRVDTTKLERLKSEYLSYNQASGPQRVGRFVVSEE